MNDFVRKTKALLNLLGNHGLDPNDPNVGPKTRMALELELSKREHDGPKPAPLPTGKAPAWYIFAKTKEGKKETDPEFNKEMSKKWAIFGLNLGTIAKNWAAWCGLAIGVSLSAVGLQVQKDGAGAKNWDKYGVAINWKQDGIPRGAIVRINHGAKCDVSGNNHVTMADGNCAALDLLKPNATFNGYGGNQGNTWKVSSFPVAHICAVRWPAEAEAPPKIEKSEKCNGADKTGTTQ